MWKRGEVVPLEEFDEWPASPAKQTPSPPRAAADDDDFCFHLMLLNE